MINMKIKIICRYNSYCVTGYECNEFSWSFPERIPVFLISGISNIVNSSFPRQWIMILMGTNKYIWNVFILKQYIIIPDIFCYKIFSLSICYLCSSKKYSAYVSFFQSLNRLLCTLYVHGLWCPFVNNGQNKITLRILLFACIMFRWDGLHPFVILQILSKLHLSCNNTIHWDYL